MSDSQTVSASYLRGCSENLGNGFWQQWEQYRDYLHRCCIKWMGGNPTDAEDALSRAMLKAWEKVQKYAAGEISNFKAWLTTLTRNLCVDIYRERSRGANRVEDIEGYARSEEQGLVRSEDTLYCAMETDEKRMVIRRAIDNLPPRLRETFILHFYQELSYPGIAQQQEISYQNVCKRISQARKILRLELKGYFIEEEGTDTDKSVPLTATESAIGEMSEGNAPVEAGAEETVTLSVAVEEVESVVSEEAQEIGCDVQQSESVMVAATSERKLEVKSDGCRCVEAALCERQLAPILALAQFEEETGSWGNSCLAVLWRQQQLMVGKLRENLCARPALLLAEVTRRRVIKRREKRQTNRVQQRTLTMTNYVYAVVYSSKQEVLVATKKQKAYYYCSTYSPPDKLGQVQPQGIDIPKTHAPGKKCLPGGKLDDNTAVPSNEIWINGAIKEFQEETGVKLLKTDSEKEKEKAFLEYAYYENATVKSWKQDSKRPNQGNYAGVYFKVKNLPDILEKVKFTLSYAMQAETGVRLGHITNCGEILKDCPIADNELDSVEIVDLNVGSEKNKLINEWMQPGQYTDWYAKIIENIELNHQYKQ